MSIGRSLLISCSFFLAPLTPEVLLTKGVLFSPLASSFLLYCFYMKKLFSFFLAAFLLLSTAGQVFAQSSQNEIFFGQQHAYTVVFRGNGEAVVSNPNETPMTDFSFSIPGAQVSELSMYQITLPRQCVRYGASVGQGQICLEWREPDYQNQYGYSSGGKTEYQKITYSVSGNAYHFTFPRPVEKFATTAIVFSYAAKGYVTERAGLYSFEFQTIKVPSRITEVRVTVDVDSDLYLDGKRSSVNYENSGMALRTTDAASVGQSAAMDSYVSRIGSYGPIMKTGKNLSPEETFIVKGSYAKSWFRMHLMSISLSILLLVVLTVGVPLLAHWMKRRKHAKKNAVIASSASSFSPFGFQNILVSFASVVLIAGWSFFIQWFMSSDLSQYISSSPFVEILFAVVIVLMYIILVFGPPVVIGLKKGWKAGLWMVATEFCWLLIILIIVALLSYQTVRRDY
jgi:hypothetical protein